MLEKIICEHIGEDLKLKAIKAHFKQQTISSLDLEKKTTLAGQTPLHLAVSLGLVEVSKLLVELGSDIDALDVGHQTPLHYAAESGHPELILFFGHHRGLLNLKSDVGDTPMHKAVQSKHPACVLALLKASNFMLDTTIVNLKIQTPWDLLKSIEDLKIKQAMAEVLSTPADYFGRSAFHVDVIHGDLELVKLHADSGAQINEQDKEGNTALHLAVKCGHRAIVYWLCNNYEGNINSDEINFDIQDNQGNTPLHISAEKKDAACIKFLVSGKKPARKDIINNKGLLPGEIIKKRSIDDEEIKILEDALASTYLTNMHTEDYEKELFPPEPQRPSGYLGYFASDKKLKILAESLASPHFERKFSRRFSEGTHSQLRLAPTAQHRKSIRPIISLSRQEMINSSEADFAEQTLAHPKETEGEFSLEKAFETHDISHALHRIKNVKTANDYQFLLEEFKKFSKKFHTENANIFLEVLAENLVPVLRSSEENFVKNCTQIQKLLHKKLCADGLRKMFAVNEINTLDVKDLNAISTDEKTQNILQALVKLCSGVTKNTKNANDYVFDSNKLRVNLLGLIDFNEVEEIIILLSKLQTYFSNIQRLMSHYIVFIIIKNCHDYGYDPESGSVAKSINFYIDNCCDNATKKLLFEYKDLLYSFKTCSSHSLIQQINSLISNAIFSKKESIIRNIAEYMDKNPIVLKNTEMEYQTVDVICRAFTEINTKFYQTLEIRKWRLKCFDVMNLDVPSELLKYNQIINLMTTFIKKTILSYATQQKRAQAMTLFLLVAREAFHNRPDPQIAAPDFTTAVAVYFALVSHDISKLKLTSLLDKAVKRIETALSILASPGGGFKRYESLQAADHRILPFTAAIFQKKSYMYEHELYSFSEILGEMYDNLIFIKNRLAKVVFLNNQSDLEEQLQQLKNQSLDDDVPVRKRSSDRQRLSQPPPSKEIIPSRKLSFTEDNVPRKKPSTERKLPKIKSLSLEDNAGFIEHPDEEKTLHRTSAPRKASLSQGSTPRKELHERETPLIKHPIAEAQKHSERKAPKPRRSSNENRLSSLIHPEIHVISPQLLPGERNPSSEEGASLQYDHLEQETQPTSTRHTSGSSPKSIIKPIRSKFSLSSSEEKSSATSPRNYPNPASLFQPGSSSSDGEIENLDSNFKKELN